MLIYPPLGTWLCTTQFFPCRERVGAISAAYPAVCLPLLAVLCLYRDRLEAHSFTSNVLLMFWLSSFLSFFVLVLSGWPLGLPGDR